jgi:6-phosphofructokinase 2
MSQAPILTITLNPALDITTTTEALEPQRKLRCDRPRYDAGGGGVNVSRAIKELGGTSQAFVVLGGPTGEHFLNVLGPSEIDTHIYRGAGDTRFSLTVMEKSSGLHYRFLLPGPEQVAADTDALLASIMARIAPASLVVASGTLPPGLPVDFYGRVSREVRARGASLILDTSEPALSAALPARPYCIRVNHHEARDIVGGEPIAAAEAFAHQLIDRDLAEVAIITAGDQGAFVSTKGTFLKISPPRVSVRSSVGAGDSFVAALALGLARGWRVEDAARFGVAAAAAAVTTEATELCRRSDAERFYAALTKEAA